MVDHRWPCGHLTGAACAECAQQSLQRAYHLAEENHLLAQDNARLRGELARTQALIIIAERSIRRRLPIGAA